MSDEAEYRCAGKSLSVVTRDRVLASSFLCDRSRFRAPRGRSRNPSATGRFLVFWAVFRTLFQFKPHFFSYFKQCVFSQRTSEPSASKENVMAKGNNSKKKEVKKPKKDAKAPAKPAAPAKKK